MKLTCFKPHDADCADIREEEAGYFARCLLMPEAKFRELAEQGCTIDELSEYFVVPKGQVCRRLTCIGGFFIFIKEQRG